MTNSNERTEKLLTQDSKEVTNISSMISRAIDESLSRMIPLITEGRNKDPLSDYIPKSEVRGKIMSSSTLWKHERKGSLKTYAIGGKRFYRRDEIQNLIQEVKR
jgi:hypothetical protein